jgi:hypothetical protein
MKFIFTIALLFFTATAQAQLNWDDLEVGPKYHLAFDLQFDNGVQLKTDTPLVLLEAISFQAPVIYFAFKNLSCTDPNLAAEMILFNPEPDDHVHDKSVGVELDKDCIVGVYIEPRFYYNKSLLR